MKKIDVSTPTYPNTFTNVDDEDFNKFNWWKWAASKHYGILYVVRYHGIRLHREIMGATKGDRRVIDHINGDGLDNRKSNLRFCSVAENTRNMRKKKLNTSSRYKGVCWNRVAEKWMAYITKNYKQKTIGYYETEEKAAIAYNKEAVNLFGEFANLNILELNNGRT